MRTPRLLQKRLRQTIGFCGFQLARRVACLASLFICQSVLFVHYLRCGNNAVLGQVLFRIVHFSSGFILSCKAFGDHPVFLTLYMTKYPVFVMSIPARIVQRMLMDLFPCFFWAAHLTKRTSSERFSRSDVFPNSLHDVRLENALHSPETTLPK